MTKKEKEINNNKKNKNKNQKKKNIVTKKDSQLNDIINNFNEAKEYLEYQKNMKGRW